MGIVKNWTTTYPGAIDVVTAGGSMEAVIDGVDDVMASHPNSLATAVIALEGTANSIKAYAIDVAVDGEQTGTSAKFIGAVKIPAGTSNSIKTLIGCVDVTTAATLEIRRFTTGTTVTTLGGIAGGLTERTQTAVAFPATDWYGFYLYGDGAPTVSFCKGVTIELPE
jgi:hypothetical protein